MSICCDCIFRNFHQQQLKQICFIVGHRKNLKKVLIGTLGHNTLDKKLKLIFDRAKISSARKSNHSLRATSISRLYQAEVPEKLIMERSGHLTKEGLRSYERTSSEQLQSVCKTLASFVPVETTHELSSTSKSEFPSDGIKDKEKPENDTASSSTSINETAEFPSDEIKDKENLKMTRHQAAMKQLVMF